MEVKRKEQKTFMYALTFNSSEVDQIIDELDHLAPEIGAPNVCSVLYELIAARGNAVADE